VAKKVSAKKTTTSRGTPKKDVKKAVAAPSKTTRPAIAKKSAAKTIATKKITGKSGPKTATAGRTSATDAGKPKAKMAATKTTTANRIKKGERDTALKRPGSSSPADIGVDSNSKPLTPVASKRAESSEKETKAVKTYLTTKELREFRDLLIAKRAELAGDVTHLTDGISNRKGENGGQQSSMPIHMADLGSDNWEHEFTLGLIANERQRIREIDEALARIDDKTYGICVATNKQITKARLRAKPWAKYCIDYARAREEGRAP
jgi:DnaK suppressor protein